MQPPPQTIPLRNRPNSASHAETGPMALLATLKQEVSDIAAETVQIVPAVVTTSVPLMTLSVPTVGRNGTSGACAAHSTREATITPPTL